MTKLNSKKQKKFPFYVEKSLVGLTPRSKNETPDAKGSQSEVVLSGKRSRECFCQILWTRWKVKNGLQLKPKIFFLTAPIKVE